jgi:hypothetical protein
MVLKTRYQLALLSLVFLFITPSYAIRSVGNGGGLAEMRVVYLFQNADRFLRICLSDANVCGLSAETRADWQAISNDKGQSGYVISFVNEVDDKKGFSVDGKKLFVSNKRLYIDSDTPRDFNDLLAFVITVKQDLIGSSGLFEENLQIAQRVFAELSIEEKNFKVADMSSLLRLTQLKAFDGFLNHFLIGLEDEEKTIDISKDIKDKIPCGNFSEWVLNQWSAVVTSSTLYFYGNASSNCAGKRVEKRIVIRAGLKDTLIINGDSIVVDFYAK